jgi:hypothetical protein
MNISITEKNLSRIQTELDRIQKRASARIIDASDIVDDVKRIEKRLDIPKKHMTGISAIVDHYAQDFPHAYKWTAESTHYTIVRKSGGWTLTNVYRDTVKRPSQRYTVNLTEDAKNAIIESRTCFE